MENEKNLEQQFMRMESLLRRYYHRTMSKQGMFGQHRGQGRVLLLLKLHPVISQKDLAYVLGMRPQSLGELLGKLEKNEWITREPSTEDRRIMMVSLTEAGKEAAEKIADRPQIGVELFEQFTEEERTVFLSYIDRMIDKMTEELGEEEMDDRFAEFGGVHGFQGMHGGHGRGHQEMRDPRRFGGEGGPRRERWMDDFFGF